MPQMPQTLLWSQTSTAHLITHNSISTWGMRSRHDTAAHAMSSMTWHDTIGLTHSHLCWHTPEQSMPQAAHEAALQTCCTINLAAEPHVPTEVCCSTFQVVGSGFGELGQTLSWA